MHDKVSDARKPDSSWILFAILAYAISWLIQLPYILDNRELISLPDALLGVLGPVSTFGPAAAALLLAWREGRLGALLRRAAGIRIRWYYWIAALAIWPLVQGLGFLVAWGIGDWPVEAGMIMPMTILPLVFLQTLVIGGPLGEELGWRGYALPALLKTRGPIVASLILGMIHAFWHLPLWFVVGDGSRDMPFLLFALNVVSQTPIYTWLTLRSNGSIWPAILFHTTQNMLFFHVFSVPNGLPVFALFFYIAVIAVVVALVRNNGPLTNPQNPSPAD